MLNPIIGGALITGGASLLSGIGGLFGQQSTNNTNIKLMREQNAFNAEEAQKARDFNSQEAAIARQFNSQEAALNRKFQEQMYQKSLDWRSPVHQLKLMQEAGLNPNNFQNGVVSVSSPSGNAASGPAASGPSASSAGTPTVQNPYTSAIDAMTRMASILSDAKLKEQQGNLIDAQRATEDALRNGKVELANSQISLNIVNTALTKRQELKLGKEIIQIDVATEKLSAEITKLRADTLYTEEQTRYQNLKSDEQEKINARLEERIDKELRSLDDAHKYNNAQLDLMKQQLTQLILGNISTILKLPFELNDMNATINLKDSQRAAIDLTTKRPQSWNKILPHLNAAKDVLDIYSTILGNSTNILKSIGGIVK